MTTAVVLVAAGAGVRARTDGVDTPKQYRDLGGKPVVAHTLANFVGHPAIDLVQPVVRAGTEAQFRSLAARFSGVAPPVVGGADRQASVRNGLEALADAAPRYVLIHDAVRPFAGAALVDRILAALAVHDGAVPTLPVADTLKRVEDDGRIAATVPRAGLRAAQTPQAFHFDAILAAHRALAGEAFTDDAAVAEAFGLDVVAVEGDPANVKLTTPEDFAMAETRTGSIFAAETRVGSGYDVHRFRDGDHVCLCGVRVPFERGLAGHSDADVGLHALTDALLGAVADGDIGSHFPPSDPEWAGVDSSVFLSRAAEIVHARQGRIVNTDVTLICEAPKIGPHRDAMRARIAGILGIDPGRVSVKATTSERLGFVGRREGIAAQATAAVAMPSSGGTT